MPEEELNLRASRVRLILMDVDGVLTDGRIWYVPHGDGLEEVKAFDAADGAGIALAHKAGLATGIVSGRASAAVLHRARELGIEEVHLGVVDKAAVLARISDSRSIAVEDIAFIGDEVVDLPAMRRVGFSSRGFQRIRRRQTARRICHDGRRRPRRRPRNDRVDSFGRRESGTLS